VNVLLVLLLAIALQLNEGLVVGAFSRLLRFFVFAFCGGFGEFSTTAFVVGLVRLVPFDYRTLDGGYLALGHIHTGVRLLGLDLLASTEVGLSFLGGLLLKLGARG